MAESICFLNGDVLPLAQASVSVLDRGFIFGDAIYEVIPVFAGRAFRFAEHLARLRTNLDAVLISLPLSETELIAHCENIIARNNGGDQTLYVQVSRGVAPRNHVLEKAVSASIFIMSNPLAVAEDVQPIAAVTCADERWNRCDIKSTSLLANVLARERAKLADADEAIFIRDGQVTEGASSNIFIASGGEVKTPPLSNYILPGVTRNCLVELCADSVQPIIETSIGTAELHAADEIWVTSSGRELVPVTTLDGKIVGDGEIGANFCHLLQVYRDYKASI